ncbi:hypothetical protein P171DRAFT_447885 [Karstenula rhodostoma CBS 690.94]|uniref:Uncharacterized protein n=1 Tax=Karstenula rhodostoma CBS 690.94 TaxID=1392251 RepID=A0A9P4U8C8_9PLEO|nr:hypothetical protein P171DRAFT_447885 [Karstenula rhodostoma CBS 690.94]
MRASTLTFLATAATAAAETQIPFFLPGMGSSGVGVAPDASIMAGDASTTVMALACPTGVDETECGWGNKDMIVSIVGKNTYALAYSFAGVRFDCTSKGAMTCTAQIAQEFTDAGLDDFTAGNDGTATGTTVYPSSEVVFQTARVTAGEEKLTAESGAVQTSASGTAKESGPKETGASSTLRTTGSVASTGAAPSATEADVTGTPTGSAAPVENTGAAARFGAAFVAIAGAAAVSLYDSGVISNPSVYSPIMNNPMSTISTTTDPSSSLDLVKLSAVTKCMTWGLRSLHGVDMDHHGLWGFATKSRPASDFESLLLEGTSKTGSVDNGIRNGCEKCQISGKFIRP